MGVSAIVGRAAIALRRRIDELKDEEPAEKKSEIEFRGVQMLVMRPHVCVERLECGDTPNYSSQLRDTKGPTRKKREAEEAKKERHDFRKRRSGIG